MCFDAATFAHFYHGQHGIVWICKYVEEWLLICLLQFFPQNWLILKPCWHTLWRFSLSPLFLSWIKMLLLKHKRREIFIDFLCNMSKKDTELLIWWYVPRRPRVRWWRRYIYALMNFCLSKRVDIPPLVSQWLQRIAQPCSSRKLTFFRAHLTWWSDSIAF